MFILKHLKRYFTYIKHLKRYFHIKMVDKKYFRKMMIQFEYYNTNNYITLYNIICKVHTPIKCTPTKHRFNKLTTRINGIQFCVRDLHWNSVPDFIFTRKTNSKPEVHIIIFITCSVPTYYFTKKVII